MSWYRFQSEEALYWTVSFKSFALDLGGDALSVPSKNLVFLDSVPNFFMANKQGRYTNIKFGLDG